MIAMVLRCLVFLRTTIQTVISSEGSDCVHAEVETRRGDYAESSVESNGKGTLLCVVGTLSTLGETVRTTLVSRQEALYPPGGL